MKDHDCAEQAARELDRLQKLLTSVAGATHYWMRVIAEATEALKTPIDRAELNEIYSKICSRRATDAEIDRYHELCFRRDNCEKAPGSLRVASFAIWALRLLVEGKKRVEVLAELASRPWQTKHEVLTRWAWMEAEREKVLCDKRFDAKLDRPFQCCPCLDDDRPGHNLGREFDTLLCFLRHLRDRTGEELLIATKREGPDFEVEKVGGNRIGVEATDAPIRAGGQSDFYAERRARAELERSLDPILRRRGESIEFQGAKSWTERLAAVDPLREQLDVAPPAPAHFEIESNGHRISADLFRSAKPRVESDALGYMGGDLVGTVKRSIREKLKGRKPAIRPCILAVYPVCITRVDLGTVARALTDDLSTQPVSTHFDEVWLCKEDFAAKLWP
jgi:hypothetical protein